MAYAHPGSVMRRRQPDRRPDRCGATPFQYRAGADVAGVNKPPAWRPAMVYRSEYKYRREESVKDLRMWLVTTWLSEQRKGPLVSLATWPNALRDALWLHFIDNASAECALVKGSASVHSGDVIVGAQKKATCVAWAD